MENLSKSERRKLKKQRRKERLAMEMKEERRTSAKKNIRIYGLVVVIIVALVYLGFQVSSMMSSAPGLYDEFTNCLTEKGVVVYGNDWCTYTKQQMGPFGNSFPNLNYVRCDDNKQLCDQKGVSITPTWEIGGKIYSGIQSFQTLGELSGCEL
jgi:hypothetical protein